MTAPFLADERLVDLLIQQATSGLDADEQAELDRLLKLYPDADPAAIEATVGALTLAGRFDDEPLPARLRERLITAEAATRGRAATSDFAAHVAARTPAAAPKPRAVPGGWWAAAAAVLVAIAGWYPRFSTPPEAPPPAAPPTLSEQRSQLIASSRQLVRFEITATKDPAAQAAGGDVVWDPVSQRGYLHLKGLAANDAHESQYQLWVFDGDRDTRYPVDGGVFDIPAGQAEVVVPIVVRLRVDKPAMFAVTVEKPGGVVVSGRERIAVLAKPAST